MPKPHAHLLTWTTYGAHLHGDELWTVHKHAAEPGDPFVMPEAHRLETSRALLRHDPVVLSDRERTIVDEAIRAHASFRGWTLDALNVRTNHVHAVVDLGAIAPEQAMTQFKSWSTRRLRETGLRGAEDRVWAKHGSTRYLFDAESARAAIDYVLNRQ